MKRKTIEISIAIAVLTLIVGAIAYAIADLFNVFEHNAYIDFVYYDKDQNQGVQSTVYKDKIYYYSNEQDGINGIYTMNLDGSNVELLIECPYVKQIAVFEDKLYYVGLFKHYEVGNNYNPYAYYTIYESDDFKTSEVFDESLEVVDIAYFFDDDTAFVREGHWGTRHYYYNEQYRLYDDGQEVCMTNDNYYEEHYHLLSEDEDTVVGMYTNIPAVFLGINATWDTDTFQKSFQATAAFDTSNEYMIFYEHNRYYPKTRYLKGENSIIMFDWPNLEVLDLEDFLSNESYYVKVMNMKSNKGYNAYLRNATKNYIFIEQMSDDIDKTQDWRAVVIDRNSGIMNEILTINNEFIYCLYFDENSLITMEDRRVKIYKHDCEQIISEETLVKIKNKKIVVSAAGDWLFLYEGQDGDIQLALLYKINILTGEVFENTVPFDSTQHDAIYIDEEAPEYK